MQADEAARPEDRGWLRPQIKGPARLVARKEDELSMIAVIAAGVPGRGPWKIVTARYDLIRKTINTLNHGNWLRLEASAVVYVRADAFAKVLKSAIETEARRGSHLPEPWFLFEQDRLARLMTGVATVHGIEALSPAEYAARIEGFVAKDLNG